MLQLIAQNFRTNETDLHNPKHWGVIYFFLILAFYKEPKLILCIVICLYKADSIVRKNELVLISLH